MERQFLGQEKGVSKTGKWEEGMKTVATNHIRNEGGGAGIDAYRTEPGPAADGDGLDFVAVVVEARCWP